MDQELGILQKQLLGLEIGFIELLNILKHSWWFFLKIRPKMCSIFRSSVYTIKSNLKVFPPRKKQNKIGQITAELVWLCENKIYSTRGRSLFLVL